MEDLCPKCNARLEENYNYCPVCGQPLNNLAEQTEQLKISNAVLKKIDELASTIKDPSVLQTIKNFIKNN